MAVAYSGGIFTKTEEGYYVMFDPGKIEKPVTGGGYLQAGSVSSVYPIVDLDPAVPADAGLIAAFSTVYPTNYLASFFYKIYAAGLFIGGGESINMHRAIVDAGLYNPPLTISGGSIVNNDPYEGIRPLDFMALTGAKIVPEGIGAYIPSAANPTPPTRPNLWEVEDGDTDGRQNMFDVIKFMGMWGILKHLYIAKGGITWEEFVKCAIQWMPDASDRIAYFPVLRSFLIANQQPTLTEKQRNEFLA